MLKRLQVRDFKSLRELEVEFGRLTVLVGANGCGKSSVLQAIKLVRELALAPPSTVGFDAELASKPLGAKRPSPAISVEIEDKYLHLGIDAAFIASGNRERERQCLSDLPLDADHCEGCGLTSFLTELRERVVSVFI